MSERSPTDETGSRKSKQERLAAKERAEKPPVNEGRESDVDKEMQRFCSELRESEKKRRETSGQVEREMEQFAREDSTKERTAGQGEKKTTITGVRETAGPDSVKGQAAPHLRHERSAEAGQPRPDIAEEPSDRTSERVAVHSSTERTGVHAPTSVPENPHPSEARKPERLPEGVPTQDELDRGMERHPYMRDRDSFVHEVKEARAYIELKEGGPKSDVEFQRFAESHDILLKKVTDWDQGRRTPPLIDRIKSDDRYRERYERGLSPAARERCIDPSTAYEAFKDLREVKDPKPEQIAECIQKLTGALDESHRVAWCRMYPYSPRGPMWMPAIGERIADNRSEVQRALNERLNLQGDTSREVRVGVSGNRLCVWLKDTGSDNWMNHYDNENFHFKDASVKRGMIEEAESSLGIGGRIQFGRLVAQVTDYPRATSDVRVNADLAHTHGHLRGETLHFMMDVLSLSNADIESRIDYIGRGKRGWGVIRSPRLCTDVESVLVPIASTVKSDCHIDPNGHMTYSDDNPERISRVRRSFCGLGDVDISERKHQITGTPYLHMPAVVGRLLMGLGMEPGDKAILNQGLPDLVMHAKPPRKAAYLKELISDDGGFTVENRLGEFWWCRSVVLDAGNKAERYNHESQIDEEELRLIHSDKNRVSRDYGYKESEREEYHLRIGTLRRLTKSEDPEVSRVALSLLSKVEANPPRLMEDERKLCRDLGIKTGQYPVVVIFFPGSKRVSVGWRAQTAGNEQALIWAREAMPNHPVKAEAVSNWLKSRAEIARGEGVSQNDDDKVTI